jgi:hypothetical protein
MPDMGWTWSARWEKRRGKMKRDKSREIDGGGRRRGEERMVAALRDEVESKQGESQPHHS